MANLPLEVLHLIFPRLLKQDMLECMTVCRQWKFAANHCLFQVIYLDSLEKLNKLIERVKKEPTLGAATKRLVLKLNLGKDFDDTILYSAFPNVRDFTLINKIKENPVEEPAKAHNNHEWCQHIERVVENLPYKFTKSLLSSGPCRNLTHLSLLGRDQQPGQGHELIEIISNAPALTTLKLRAYEFTFRDFDILPELLPSLSSIYLYECYIDFASLPAHIKPATAVTSFRTELSEGEMYIHDNNYVKYISQKYPNLEELGFEGRNFSSESEDDEEPAAEHRAVMTSYMHTLGTRLKTLLVDLQSWDYDFTPGFDFDILDECGCQIKKLVLISSTYLSMMERLAKTGQTRYIQSLDIKEVAFALNDFSKVISYKWLTHFTALKELSLHFGYAIESRKTYKMKLTDLLDALAGTQVDTLRLQSVHLVFETSDTNRTYPSIKELQLSFCDLKFNVDTVISQALPNLKSLILDGCWRCKRTFAFPKSELSYFQVSNVHVTKPLHVLLITLDDSQQRTYTTHSKPLDTGLEWDNARDDPYGYPPNYLHPYASSSDVPRLTFICKSVSNFFIAASEY